jgi:hypothetical protein
MSALATAPPSGHESAPPGRRRNVAIIVVAVLAVVALLVAAALLVGGGTRSEVTVDQATDPDGLAAFVLLLEAFDAEVGDVSPAMLASDDPDVVLVLPGSRIDDDARTALDVWADGAAGAVIVDAADLTGRAPSRRAPPTPAATSLRRGESCREPAFADVELVTASADSALLLGDTADDTCFRAGATTRSPSFAVVAEEPLGRAAVVVLADVSPFTNRLLDENDNAVLATSLFAPEPGVRVRFLVGQGGLPTSEGVIDGGSGAGRGTGGDQPEDGGADERTPRSDGSNDPTLLDAVPVGVRWALLQLLVAFVLYAWWRGRRVGAPVPEPLPVDIEGSELVAAVGDLLARVGSASRAGDVLRAETRRALALRLGLARDIGAEGLSAAVARRSGRTPAEVEAVLFGHGPNDGEALVALAARLDTLREEVLDGIRA